MPPRRLSILQAVNAINDETAESGGFWLPNLQREFVWKETQICQLFDSILRRFPIHSLLIWKTRQEVQCRKFEDVYTPKQGISGLFVPKNTYRKCLVLDGQQRLQSLFIGLKGSFDGKELYLNVSPDEPIHSATFDFNFYSPNDLKHTKYPNVRFHDIVYGIDRVKVEESIVQKAKKDGWNIDQACRQEISSLVDRVFTTFSDSDGVIYQEIEGINPHSTDNAELYSIDDVAEIFVRANSGGTKLSKSELLFALLSTDWDELRSDMEKFLGKLNRSQYDFEQDFVLKTCLTVLDKRAEYKAEKLRDEHTRQAIQDNWECITNAIGDVVDFVSDKTLIKNGKALPSMNCLIPLIYLRYHCGKEALYKDAESVRTYLIRALLAGTFNYNVDYLLNSLVDCINVLKEDKKGFDLKTIVETIHETRHNWSITETQLFSMGYKHPNNLLLFSLWYGMDYKPALKENASQVDHIFPQSELKKVQQLNPDTGRYVQMYPVTKRNTLANCMLLTANENGKKSDTLPRDWFQNKSKDYLKLHLIPDDPALWELAKFEQFIEARENLIREHFAYLVDTP